MSTKSVACDFGERQIDVDVPAHASVVQFEDPKTFLADPEAAVREALARPIGSPPLSALAKPGMRVVIGFDDPTRPPTPWQTILPVLIEELLKAGIRERDILLVSANGAHRKWRPEEFRNYLGPKIFDRFFPTRQIVNHDCHDPAGLRFLGTTERGGYLEYNKAFVDADLPIYVGTISASYVGGYTGMGTVIGLGSVESIASNHSHYYWDHPKSTTGDHRTMLYRGLKAHMHERLEQAMGKRVFYVNSVSGIRGRMVGVFAGHSPELDGPAWDLADTFNLYPVPQADVIVVGLGSAFAYGSADNPLVGLVGSCYPSRIWVNRPVLREGGVIIALNPSTGNYDTRTFPSTPAVIDLFRRHHSIGELQEHEGDVTHRPEFLHLYHHHYAYHPRHPFWLFYIGDYTLKRAGAVIMAGAKNPGAYRDIGVRPERDFKDAWQTAEKIVGKNPRTIVAPRFWSRRLLKFDVRE